MSAAPRDVTTAALLARALEETRAVESLIEQGEWQQALERDAARQRLLLAAFGQDARRTQDPELRALTDELLKMNNRLIGLAEHRRRAVERESDVLQVGRRAAAAYHQVQPDRQRS
jgi:hypothetical protein